MATNGKDYRANLTALREATAMLAGLRRTLKNSSQGKRVLWVDDQPSNNGLPRLLLKQAGASVIIALSTDDARRALAHRRTAVDLVISDMSRGNNPFAGLELLKHIRDRGRDIPVLIYSDNPLAEKRREAIRALGGIGPLVGPQNLMEVIASTLTPKKPNKAMEPD